MKPVALRARHDIGADIIAKRRARAIADIMTQLRPYKRGVDQVAMREDIRTIVENISLVTAVRPWSAGAKNKAARVAKALRALEPHLPEFAGFPPFARFDFVAVMMGFEAIAGSTGPDPRFSFLDWICGHQARVLLKKYSSQQPVTTRGGNVHMIARLLREVATGQPGTPAGLLKCIKQSNGDEMQRLADHIVAASKGRQDREQVLEWLLSKKK
jgi:hypothetical protein